MAYKLFEQLLDGTAWNQVWPQQQPPNLPHKSARDYALERLFDYLAGVTWRHTGATEDETVAFQIKRCNMFVEQPEGNIKLSFPAIGVLPGEMALLQPSLGFPVLIEEESSECDSVEANTALARIGEWYEEVMLDMWFETRSQRRAVLAGMEGPVFHPNNGVLYLTLPDYFNRIVEFRFISCRRFDGDIAVRNRREAQVKLGMRVEALHKVLVRDFEPHVGLDVT
jgi:hypothetical protein